MRKYIKNNLLLPLSIIYGSITYIRNKMFDLRILKSEKMPIPVISVGNLAVGGTGKTPHVEFILNILNDKNVAMLSRGYKRKTKGFVLANNNSNSNSIGDEPFQIFRKFKDVKIAVDEKRVRGINQLVHYYPKLDAIVLDDAFQHRKVNPGLKILLTDYNHLYVDDKILPVGRLREFISGAKRADIIIVTKCAPTLSTNEMQFVTKKINPLVHQKVFFTTIKYNAIKPVFDTEKQSVITDLTGYMVLLVTGIVSPAPIIAELKSKNAIVESISFPDHHNFTLNNYAEIEQKFIHLHSENKIVLVTEKDAARIVTSSHYPESLKSYTFYLPIEIDFLQNKYLTFTQTIRNYVETDTRNC
ncbi:MAG: tetraacyldisaccharide 4'-kinase [Paludibacter sp.]